MGRIFAEHRGGRIIYTCKGCQVYLTNKEEIVSTKFQGASGKAYLFARAWNIVAGQAVVREMMTGSHLVRDISCKFCDFKLGWIYEMAIPQDQQYKEGRVILEKNLINEEEGPDDRVRDLSMDEPIQIVYEPAETETTVRQRRKALAMLLRPHRSHHSNESSSSTHSDESSD